MKASVGAHIAWMGSLALSLGLHAAYAESGGDFIPSGVSTEAIQLPQAAGSVQGIERESASVGNTGTLRYSVPIQVPKGRNGLQPDLRLAYESAAGEGPFGVGWKINISAVERSPLRGVPQYNSSDLISSIDDGELVNLGSGSYRPLIDNSQSWYLYDQGTDSWQQKRGNGNIVTYGGRSDAKVTNASGTVKWLVSTISDPFNNRIEYFYTQDQGQAYLSEVRYVFTDSGLTSNLYKIQFSYESRPDQLTSYQSTYAVKTALRCTDIRVSSHQLIRHYKLSYDLTSTGKLSRLRKVQLYGTDDTTAYPPLDFSYSVEPSLSGRSSQSITFQGQARPPSMSNAQVTFADLNGDGTPDILSTSEKGAQVWTANSDGTYQAASGVPNLIGELGAKNSRLMDVNGDRHVDFVGSGQYPKYWPSNGSGGFSAPIDLTHFPRYSLGSRQVRTIDVNGDGRMDLVAQEPDAIYTFFNDGNGKWDRYVKLPFSQQEPYPMFDFSSPNTVFVDMNGDGLSDIAYVALDRIYYYPNLGNGHWGAIVSVNFSDVNYQNGCASAEKCTTPSPILYAAQHTKDVFLVDINGDGLSDLVVAYQNELLYAFNQGDGTFSTTQSYTNIHQGTFDPYRMSITFADVNGNGSQDVVWSNEYGDYRYFDFVGDVKPNLLTEIDNGMGKKVQISYAPHTRYGQSDLLLPGAGRIPFIAQTVKEIQTFNWSSVASDSLYKYFGGYYDGQKNEFRGFALIEKTDLGDESVPDRLERRFYETGENSSLDKARGLEVKTEIRSSSGSRNKKRSRVVEGNLLYGEENSLSQVQTATNAQSDSSGFGFIAAKTILEGDDTGASRSYEVDSDYVLNNGAIASLTRTTKDTSGAVYRKVRDTFAQGVSFSGGAPTLWNVENIQQRDVLDSSDNVKLSTRFYFDGSSQLGAVTYGKVTRKDALQGSAYVTKATYSWSPQGNLSSFADAASHTTNVIYDPNYSLLPISVANPKSQTELAAYNFDLGVMTSSTNVNSISQYYSYDPLLRLSTITGPLASGVAPDPNKPTIQYSYTFGSDSGLPSSIQMTQLTDIGEISSIATKQYFDSLGRPLSTVHQGNPGQFIHDGGVVYNLHGKVKQQYLPFFVSDLGQYTLNTLRPSKKSSFDALERVTLSINPESTASQPSQRSTLHKVGETRETDENGHTTVKYFDFLHRLTSTKDPKNYSTSFTYSPLDQVASIQDAKGEITLFEYDSLMRRTCKLDPNIGKTTYQYNDLDLLTEKTDFGFESGVTTCLATNSNTPRVTAFTYADALNRITAKNATDQEGAIDSITYSYDTGSNGIGKLAQANFKAGWKKFSYDVYGNVNQTDYSINGTLATLKEKRDVLGRLREVGYPSFAGEVFNVGYTYDSAGNLSSVTNAQTSAVFANNFSYNELGQLVALQFGNGVRTRRTYDADGGSYRLKEIYTYTGSEVGQSIPVSSVCTGSNSIQCLSYQYDLAANITQIADYLTDRQHRTQTFRAFTYDENDQLLHATGPWGIQDFTYDEIGNITSKTTTARRRTSGIGWVDQMATKIMHGISSSRGIVSYSYSSSRPQILTQVGSENYQFNAFGELEQQGASKTYSFNALNELVSFGGEAGVYQYDYDENGERISKSQNTNFSIFASKYFEKQGTDYFKFIFAGNRRLASLSNGSVGLQYFHQDHLGSINYITDSSGNALLHREYSPYGEVELNSGTSTQVHVGFADKYADSETGFNYFGSRFFIPWTGRWTSPDPKYSIRELSGNVESVNSLLSDHQQSALWRYVNNNPIKNIDLEGKDTVIFTVRDYIANPNSTIGKLLTSVGVNDIGTHSAMAITQSGKTTIYDPAGTFTDSGARGDQQQVSYTKTVQNFIDFHVRSGSGVDVQTFKTSIADENVMLKAIDSSKYAHPFQCTSFCSDVLKSSDLFKTMDKARIPDQLENYLRAIGDESPGYERQNFKPGEDTKQGSSLMFNDNL